MLQLKNNTPFAASMVLLPDANGVDTLFVMVSATFSIGAELSLLETQPPPHAADVYWGAPSKSSLKYASDHHLGKLATDIVLVGDACAPRGQQVTQLDVDLSVGSVTKIVRVFGDRYWRDGGITAPKPFVKMPLVYERAYGGVHLVEGAIDSAEPRNPVGRGHAGKRSESDMHDVLLPNLEDPSQLIQTHTDQPTPACFGFCAPHWQPRAAYAGTYDDAWQNTRAPYMPKDFDARFFNMAHPDLIYPGFLQGGEMVKIARMHPDSDLQFELPQRRFSVEVNIDGKITQPALNMETLLLQPNALQMSMVWRGAVPCDKKGLKIRHIRIDMLS